MPGDTSTQEDLINFISDPNTIAKAVEGSMEKRQRVMDTSIHRLSIPGYNCIHCGTTMTQDLKCSGCGWVDPQTKSPESAPIQQDKELCESFKSLFESIYEMGRRDERQQSPHLKDDCEDAVFDAMNLVQARDKELARKAEYAARFDELLTAAHNSDDILNNGYYESRCNELRKLQGQSNGEKQ